MTDRQANDPYLQHTDHRAMVVSDAANSQDDNEDGGSGGGQQAQTWQQRGRRAAPTLAPRKWIHGEQPERVRARPGEEPPLIMVAMRPYGSVEGFGTHWSRFEALIGLRKAEEGGVVVGCPERVRPPRPLRH